MSNILKPPVGIEADGQWHLKPNPETWGRTINYSFDVDVTSPNNLKNISAHDLIQLVSDTAERCVDSLIQNENQQAMKSVPNWVRFAVSDKAKGHADSVETTDGFHSRHTVQWTSELEIPQDIHPDHAMVIARKSIAKIVAKTIASDAAVIANGGEVTHNWSENL